MESINANAVFICSKLLIYFLILNPICQFFAWNYVLFVFCFVL